MKKKQLPIGVSDFKKLRENNYYYVDKSDFIREIIEASAEIILLPRPRRFGKTLNLNMLKIFFEKTDKDMKPLFKGLSIEKKDIFQKFQGKYPVIWLTLKDLKHQNWNECFNGLKMLIHDEFSRHRYLLDGNILYPEEKSWFKTILKRAGQITDYENSLKYLSKFLSNFISVPR